MQPCGGRQKHRPPLPPRVRSTGSLLGKPADRRGSGGADAAAAQHGGRKAAQRGGARVVRREGSAGRNAGLRDAETRVQTCRDALARLRTEAAEQEAQLAGQRTALTRTEAELSGENRALEQMRALRCETDAGLSSAADSDRNATSAECERMQDELAEEKAAHERSETLTRPAAREQLEQTGKRREQVEERRDCRAPGRTGRRRGNPRTSNARPPTGKPHGPAEGRGDTASGRHVGKL